MKGVYENPNSLFMENIESHLLKTTPYEMSSGGKPEAITGLSYESLVAYHNKYYHPSNSCIYSYGDLDFTKRLEFLEENYFKDYDFLEHSHDFGQCVIKKEEKKSLKVPPNPQIIDPTKQTKYGIAFYCKDINDNIQDSVGLNLLNF